MRIRKLSNNEINEIESKIQKLRSDEYYKFYFDEGEELNFPDNAYILDGKYYIDFTYYNDVCFFGIINLANNKYDRNSYYELMRLFDERLEHYKQINMWCFMENKIAYRFHKHLAKIYKTKHYEDNKYSILEVFYDFER